RGNSSTADLVDPGVARVVAGALRVNVDVVAVRVGGQSSDSDRAGVLQPVVEIALHQAGVPGRVGDGLVPGVVGGPGDGRGGGITVLIDKNLWGGVAGSAGIVPVAHGHGTGNFGAGHRRGRQTHKVDADRGRWDGCGCDAEND